jgi:hypothetical protein
MGAEGRERKLCILALTDLTPLAVREKRSRTRAVLWSADHPGCLTAQIFAGYEHNPISASVVSRYLAMSASVAHRHFDPRN